MEMQSQFFVVVAVISLVTAVWFLLIARRAERSRLLWAVGGLILGVVVTTICAGLWDGTALPYDEATRIHHLYNATAASAVIIGIVGILFMLGSGRRIRA
jgi:hypothetical protein